MPKGTHWLITGPSGCRKTTLLHLIAGLLQPANGRIMINNTDLTRLSSAKTDKWRGLHIGIIFQKSYYDFGSMVNFRIDFYLLLASIGIGFLSALLPALKAMKTDISKTLAE